MIQLPTSLMKRAATAFRPWWYLTATTLARASSEPSEFTTRTPSSNSSGSVEANSTSCSVPNSIMVCSCSGAPRARKRHHPHRYSHGRGARKKLRQLLHTGLCCHRRSNYCGFTEHEPGPLPLLSEQLPIGKTAQNLEICGDTNTRPDNGLHESGQRPRGVPSGKWFFMWYLRISGQCEGLALVSG